MTCVVEKRDLYTGQGLPEFLHRLEQSIARQIMALDHRKSQAAQGFRYGFRIVPWIAERSHRGFVAGIADDQCDTRWRKLGGLRRFCRPSTQEEASPQDGKSASQCLE